MGEIICQEKNVKPTPIAVKCGKECLIAEEMKRLILGIDEPIPPEVVCNNFQCRHNIFWEELFEGRGRFQKVQSPLATKLRNCMCLLNGGEGLGELAVGLKIGEQCHAERWNEEDYDDLHDIERQDPDIYEQAEIKFETIGETYGISKQAVDKIEKRALKKIRKEAKKRGLSEQDIN